MIQSFSLGLEFAALLLCNKTFCFNVVACKEMHITELPKISQVGKCALLPPSALSNPQKVLVYCDSPLEVTGFVILLESEVSLLVFFLIFFNKTVSSFPFSSFLFNKK